MTEGKIGSPEQILLGLQSHFVDLSSKLEDVRIAAAQQIRIALEVSPHASPLVTFPLPLLSAFEQPSLP